MAAYYTSELQNLKDQLRVVEVQIQAMRIFLEPHRNSWTGKVIEDHAGLVPLFIGLVKQKEELQIKIERIDKYAGTISL